MQRNTRKGKQNETKRNEAKRNERKQNETKWNGTFVHNVIRKCVPGEISSVTITIPRVEPFRANVVIRTGRTGGPAVRVTRSFQNTLRQHLRARRSTRAARPRRPFSVASAPGNASARRAAAAQLLLHIPGEARTSRTARFRRRRERRRSSQVAAVTFGFSRRALTGVGRPTRAGRTAISEGTNALSRPPTPAGPLPSGPGALDMGAQRSLRDL